METISQDKARKLQGDVIKLRLALEQALEWQGAIEDARPSGYGSPQLTLDWMQLAEDALKETDG